MINWDSRFMLEAISLAEDCISDSNKRPFGSVVVLDNKIIGRGTESTIIKNDPTAHSEIEAIRMACKHLNATNLSECKIYTSSEPCSMCMSAIHWSKIHTVFYGCKREEVFDFGFQDKFQLVSKRRDPLDEIDNQFKLVNLHNYEAIEVFKKWQSRKKYKLNQAVHVVS